MNAVSPSLLSCLRYISEAIAGATFAVASASPHACLRYTSGAVTGADKGGAKRVAHGKPKVKVFSRQRKYIRQTNGFSDS